MNERPAPPTENVNVALSNLLRQVETEVPPDHLVQLARQLQAALQQAQAQPGQSAQDDAG